MANRVLPNREDEALLEMVSYLRGEGFPTPAAIVEAYASNELMTKDECRATIDYEAAEAALKVCLLCAEEVVHSGPHYYGTDV